MEGMLNRQLSRTILQNIPNDAEFIKVTTAALSPEGLLERDLDTRNGILVPSGAQSDVGKTKHKDVFDHLFPKVMINAEGFILRPVLFERSEKLARRLEVFPKGLLDNDPIDAILGVIALLDTPCDGNEDCRGQCEIKDAVALF